MLIFTTPNHALAQDYLGNPTTLPDIPVQECRGSRARLYDECGSQVALFHFALERAKEEQKILLISFGAEWCIWCHVFHDYVRGGHTVFLHQFPNEDDTETYRALLYERPEADPLPMAEQVASYFEANFVLLHIDTQHAQDGDAVLKMTGAWETAGFGIPYIFSVNSAGLYASHMATSVETRRDTEDWFRGYDRAGLLGELKRLHSVADGS